MKIHILNLEDNRRDTELIIARLEEDGLDCELTRVETRKEFISALEEGGLDLVLADNSLPNFDGQSALDILKEKAPELPFIFVTGTMGEEFAVEMLKKGATDYVLKNSLFRLAPAIKRALHEAKEKTNLRLAEYALKESEERFRSVAETAADAIICLSEPDSIYFWNTKAEELFGYTAEEVMGRNLHSLIVPERYREKAYQGLNTFFLDGTGPCINKTVELMALRKDGSEFPIDLSISAMRIREEWRATGIIRDITERKQAEEKIRHKISQLSALHDIDMAITSSLDLRFTLRVILDEVSRQLKADAADILLFNEKAKTLDFAAGVGFHTDAVKNSRLPLAKRPAEKAVIERKIVSIPRLSEAKKAFAKEALFAKEGFVSYYAAPLLSKGEVKGVMEIFQRTHFEPKQEWLEFLNTLATQTVIAIDNATMFQEIREYTEALEIKAGERTRALEEANRKLQLLDQGLSGRD